MKKKKKISFSSTQSVKIFDKTKPSNDPGTIILEEFSPLKKHKRIKSPTSSSKILSLPSTPPPTSTHNNKKQTKSSPKKTSLKKKSPSSSVSAQQSSAVSSSSSSSTTSSSKPTRKRRKSPIKS